eukprot:scaffold72460_cov18-Tisochrysis_lutea.AAC.2
MPEAKRDLAGNGCVFGQWEGQGRAHLLQRLVCSESWKWDGCWGVARGSEGAAGMHPVIHGSPPAETCLFGAVRFCRTPAL